MKKLVSLILAVLIALSCVSFASAEEPVEIRYLFGLGGNLGNIVLSLIDEYNNSQSAVHVTPIQAANFSSALEQYQAGLAAGDPPTVIHTVIGHLPNIQDYLEPLNDRYENDPEFDPNDIFAGAMSCMYSTDGSKIVGVPLYASCQVAYYRMDAFDGYDIEETFKNWQNLAKAVEEIVASGKCQYGWEPMWGFGNMIDAVMSAGGSYYADAEQRTVNFLSDEWIEVMTFFHDHLQNLKDMAIHHGGTGWEYWYATIDDVMNGVAAGYTGSAADQGDLDFDVVMSHKQPGWGDHETNVQTDAHLCSMSAMATDEEKDAAWDFMKFLSSPHAQTQMSMTGGYVVTHKSAMDDPIFVEWMKDHKGMRNVIEALEYTTKNPIDITGGYINTALQDMVDNVQILGMDPVEALTTCQETAQAALDEYWAEVDAK